MNKDTIVRVVSIVGVLGVLYFLYKKVSDSGSDQDTSKDKKDDSQTNTTTDNGFSKYKVTTTDTSLNIREKASASAKKIGKLDKGQEVLLKASSTDGWMEYSTNGTTTFGYVSSLYVTKA